MKLIEDAGSFSATTGPTYVEQLRTPELSFGTYSLPNGCVDTQSPHTEDEIYVVVSGRATLWTEELSLPVGPGSTVFVPANEPHRFTEVTEDLTTLVFFAPPEGVRDQPGDDSGGG